MVNLVLLAYVFTLSAILISKVLQSLGLVWWSWRGRAAPACAWQWGTGAQRDRPDPGSGEEGYQRKGQVNKCNQLHSSLQSSSSSSRRDLILQRCKEGAQEMVWDFVEQREK